MRRRGKVGEVGLLVAVAGLGGSADQLGSVVNEDKEKRRDSPRARPHRSHCRWPVLPFYRDRKKLKTWPRAFAVSRRKMSRDAAASPPCSRMAFSIRCARPSWRNSERWPRPTRRECLPTRLGWCPANTYPPTRGPCHEAGGRSRGGSASGRAAGDSVVEVVKDGVWHRTHPMNSKIFSPSSTSANASGPSGSRRRGGARNRM